ncbi:MAG: YgfZ/GcvT domain-containing protein [Candidatus Berkiellales bacterium]
MQNLPETGITHLSHLGVLQITGPDAKTFLQGQVTCNLNNITETESRLGTHCNLKGRMQSLFRIFLKEKENHYYLSLPLSMVAIAQQNLKKYALFSKIELQDVSENVARIGIYGEKAATALADLLQQKSLHTLPIDGCIQQTDFVICRIPGSAPRFELYGTNEALQPIWSQLSTQCEQSTPHLWELFDIQAGIPTVFPATVDLLLPHHVNLVAMNGISFDKGCYLGQEIIARMHYKGNIKKHMVHAFVGETSHIPNPGDPIFVEGSRTNEAPGTVVRTSQHAMGYDLLIVIDDQYANLDGVHLGSLDGPKVMLS